jgi:hypothetical protein
MARGWGGLEGGVCAGMAILGSAVESERVRVRPTAASHAHAHAHPPLDLRRDARPPTYLRRDTHTPHRICAEMPALDGLPNATCGDTSVCQTAHLLTDAKGGWVKPGRFTNILLPPRKRVREKGKVSRIQKHYL